MKNYIKLRIIGIDKFSGYSLSFDSLLSFNKDPIF